jgi:MFS transporter, MHS family, shikimate and dehydroshikimate transport protein
MGRRWVVFSHIYFPSHDPYISILLSYATFAIGFIARALGGVIFGQLVD